MAQARRSGARLARVHAAVGAVCLAMCLSGCRQAGTATPSPWPVQAIDRAPTHNLADRCVERFDPKIDYFPEKVTVTHAASFRVSYHGHYKLLEFTPQIGSQEVVRYLLVQCGTPVPADVGDARVVRVPVRRFVSTKVEVSTAIARLGIVDRLVGVSSMRPIVVPEIVERHRHGEIEEVGVGTHSTIELAMAVAPEVVFTFYSAFADANIHARLWEAGVVGVPLGDHFEATPLGRAEWMKFLALFFNVERRASDEFAGVAERYEDLRRLTKTVAVRPKVLLGGPSTRTRWALNGGRNYMARMIEDAGGQYVWTSDSQRSLDLADVEQVYELSASASHWIAYPTGARTLAALVDDEPRLQHFGAVRRDGVFFYDKGRTPTGGYPQANDSVARPDATLADLIRILHPELLPAHALTYHYQVH
jgi:iron complex transport system substrate-binding protein